MRSNILLAGIVTMVLLLVLALPATASDYTLGIFGNANEDETINMQDVTYTELIILEYKDKTQFADAKFDGDIDILDVTQIELIILGQEKELTILDSADRTVTVDMPVERIIPIAITAYEPIWVIGAQDKVVGVRTEARELVYPWLPGIPDKPTIGTRKELDYEKILELKPDIVMSSDSKAEEISKKLEPAGITVVGVNFHEIEIFNPEFKILAKIMGEDEKAEEFILWRQNHLDLIKERTEGIEPKVRVYGEWAHVEWGTGGKTSGIHSVITAAAGYNIAGDDVGYFGNVDPEWVIVENPEIILFAAWEDMLGLTGYSIDSYEHAEQFLKEVYDRTGLKETDAVKNGRVYVIDCGSVLTACRSIVAALYCCKWFYPEQFEDLNPEEINREYFEEWLGVEYKGIWAYPSVS